VQAPTTTNGFTFELTATDDLPNDVHFGHFRRPYVAAVKFKTNQLPSNRSDNYQLIPQFNSGRLMSPGPAFKE
jgi:hypothetical protein